MSEYVNAVELLKWERKVANLTRSALRTYLERAQAAVLPSLTADGLGPIPPDPGALTATYGDWEAILRESVLPGVEDLMAQRIIGLATERGITIPAAAEALGLYGAVVTGAVAQAYAIPSVREWMETYMVSVENRMVNTPDEVFRKVSSVIDEGSAAGEGIKDLRERVQEVLTFTGNSDWAGRAELVARTEVTGAYNASALEAARVEQQVLGTVLEKVWVSSIDGRTRKTHFKADGQRRAMDEPFEIGRADLRFPGDPRGRIEETANCRCTMVTLEPEEALPSEADRQTERSETDSTVKSRDGRTRQEEIDKRAADGTVRARDEDEPRTLRAAATGETMKRTWTGRLAPIGEVSGDRRMFKAGGTFAFRTFPLPLMHQRQTSMGHDESVTIGSIRSAEIREDGIYAEGVLFDNEDSEVAAEMLTEGVTRPSIDWCDEQWELVNADGEPIDPETITEETIGDVVYQISGMTLMAATLVAKPAFDGTYVTIDGEAADTEDTEDDDAEGEPDTEEEETELAASLVAAGHPAAPVFDAAAFANPNLSEITGIRATPDGRVVGHVATWNECHVGIRDRCVLAPRSKTNYAMFHVSEVETDQGPVAVGRLTVGAGHADPKLGVIPAREHYDNAASCWALGRLYEDDHGIAFAGIVHPNATPRQIMDGTSAPLSGDWRRHGGNLELVAALTVNTPGYPVVRGASDKQGRQLSLVAAGVVHVDEEERERPLTEIVAEAARAAVASYVEHVQQVEKVTAVTGRIRDRLDTENMERAAAIAARREEILA